MKRERSFGTAIYDIYKQTKESFLGIYLFFRPAILVRDPELIKNILMRDFQHFHDRGVYCDTKRDSMSGTFFALPSEEWKLLRNRLTPVFTTGKLKGMFSFIENVGEEFVKILKPLTKQGENIEIRDLAGRYVIDCLASIAFGQEGVSTLNDPDHEFRASGKKLNSNAKFIDGFRRAATFYVPAVSKPVYSKFRFLINYLHRLLKIFRLKGLLTFMRTFCLGLVTKTIEEREKNNIVRKDLMQYLIQVGGRRMEN